MGTARLSNQNQAVQNFLNRRGDADRIVNSLRYVGKILPLSLFFLTGSSAYAAGHRAPSITGVASFVLLSGASAEGAVSFSAVPIAPVSFYLSPAVTNGTAVYVLSARPFALPALRRRGASEGPVSEARRAPGRRRLSCSGLCPHRPTGLSGTGSSARRKGLLRSRRPRSPVRTFVNESRNDHPKDKP